MTAEKNADKRFAWIAKHGGPIVDWVEQSGPRFLAEGEGLTGWHAYERGASLRPSTLHKHTDVPNGTLILELRLARHAEPGGDPVQWDSTLKLADGRYVRSHGSAADFPKALSQVDQHVRERGQMGGSPRGVKSPDHWVSWLGAFSLSAVKVKGASEIAPYRHFQVRGDAPTFEETAQLATLGRSGPEA
jgi:hypothetical protein